MHMMRSFAFALYITGAKPAHAWDVYYHINKCEQGAFEASNSCYRYDEGYYGRLIASQFGWAPIDFTGNPNSTKYKCPGLIAKIEHLDRVTNLRQPSFGSTWAGCSERGSAYNAVCRTLEPCFWFVVENQPPTPPIPPFPSPPPSPPLLPGEIGASSSARGIGAIGAIVGGLVCFVIAQVGMFACARFLKCCSCCLCNKHRKNAQAAETAETAETAATDKPPQIITHMHSRSI